jgi:putative phosphoribosyl transferase
MINVADDVSPVLFSLASAHGPVHGQLVVQPYSTGLVVLVHAAIALDSRDNLLAGIFHNAGLSTLSIDLLSRQEERFADAHHNIPLLARRLLDFLDQVKYRTQLGELANQPLGLHAANATSPVVVRVAALRDHDIAAIVCRGGLIDLAGRLYLRSLESPLLLLAAESDEQNIASNRRALQTMHCPRELKLIPEIGIDPAASAGFQIAAGEAAQWFVGHFKG